jgi:plastocyanin
MASSRSSVFPLSVVGEKPEFSQVPTFSADDHSMGPASRLLVLVCLAGAVEAGDIRGTVVIEKKLTRRTVTASAGAYQRGVAVDLERPAAADPLKFERSHVAIYLEGRPSAAVSTGTATRVASGGASQAEACATILPHLACGKNVETAAAASIEQTHREFQPDLVVIPAGATVSFPNFDPIFHNVFSLSKPKSFDLGNYPQGETRMVTFPKPGIVFVNCRLHPNMAASIVVSPTPWVAKADGEGRFDLSGVPAGEYTVVAWHKTAGFFRQRVTVSEEQAAEVRFLIPLSANAIAQPTGRR